MKPNLSDIGEQHMHSILAGLSRRRPFFYSEKDFQFCLGWALKTQYNTEVMFEKRCEPIGSEQTDKPRRQYIDIVLRGGGRIVPIELKYKTRRAAVKDEDGQDYMLLDQSAQDLGYYHFVRDIARIEAMKQEPGFHRGYAILLTNDPYYYHMGGKRSPSYEDSPVRGRREVASGPARLERQGRHLSRRGAKRRLFPLRRALAPLFGTARV